MNRRSLIGWTLAAATTPLIVHAETGARIEALSGEAFRKDGEEIRLVDIIAPATAPLTAPEPFANDAKAALARLLNGKIRIADVRDADRWSRRVAKVFRAGEGAATLQELLIAAGMARVRPESDDADFIKRLLALEESARDGRAGLWAHWRYQIFDALDASKASGAFSIVEGVVRQAAARRARTYLNFGDDYRTDFTVTAPSAAARRWEKSGFDLLALEGARVRARGYAAFINGPSIELVHPLQIEILSRADDGG